MGEGIQKRVQPDLVREIEMYDGSSFSEKMIKWKLEEVEKTLDAVQNLTDSDKPLTVDDLKDAVEEAIRDVQNNY